MFLHVSVILFIGGVSVSVLGGLCCGGLCQGGLCPGGVSVQGGLCHGDPPYGNEQAVLILLECILVYNIFHMILLLQFKTFSSFAQKYLLVIKKIFNS